MKIVRFLTKLIPIVALLGFGFIGSSFGQRNDQFYPSIVSESCLETSKVAKSEHFSIIKPENGEFALDPNEFILVSNKGQFLSRIKIDLLKSECNEGCSLINKYFIEKEDQRNVENKETAPFFSNRPYEKKTDPFAEKLLEGKNHKRTDAIKIEKIEVKKTSDNSFQLELVDDQNTHFIIDIILDGNSLECKGSEVTEQVSKFTLNQKTKMVSELPSKVFLRIAQDFNSVSLDVYTTKNNLINRKFETKDIKNTNQQKHLFQTFSNDESANNYSAIVFDEKTGFYTTIQPQDKSFFYCENENNLICLSKDKIKISAIPNIEEVVDKSENGILLYPVQSKIFENMTQSPKVITKSLLSLMNSIIEKTGSGFLGMFTIIVLLSIISSPLFYFSIKQEDKEKELEKQKEVIRIKYSGDQTKMEEELMRLHTSNASSMLSILFMIPQIFLFILLLVSVCNLSLPLHLSSFLWIDNLFAAEPHSLLNLYGLLPFNITKSVGVLLVITAIVSTDDYWSDEKDLWESLKSKALNILMIAVVYYFIFNKPVRLLALSLSAILKQIIVAIIRKIKSMRDEYKD